MATGVPILDPQGPPGKVSFSSLTKVPRVSASRMTGVRVLLPGALLNYLPSPTHPVTLSLQYEEIGKLCSFCWYFQELGHRERANQIISIRSKVVSSPSPLILFIYSALTGNYFLNSCSSIQILQNLSQAVMDQ